MIVQSLPEAQVHVPQQRAQQRTVKQAVDAHVPVSTVSGSGSMEQVMDVPGLRHAPGLARAQQLTSRAAAAWLNAPQEHFEGFFRTFPLPPKSAKGTGQSTAGVVGQPSSSTSSAYGSTTWVDDSGDAWTVVADATRSLWLNLRTRHFQWHPPWER